MLPYSPVIINLFKGVVYKSNKDNWKQLLEFETDIKKYFEVINVDIFVDDKEGFAFLKQKETDENDENLPKLIEKRQLSYPVTLLCVLLRKKLIEADSTGSDIRVVMSKDKIKDMLKVFLPDLSNEAKIMDRINEHINKVVEYGFLRKLKNSDDEYEINRIITAQINADKLQQIEESLKDYAKEYE